MMNKEINNNDKRKGLEIKTLKGITYVLLLLTLVGCSQKETTNKQKGTKESTSLSQIKTRISSKEKEKPLFTDEDYAAAGYLSIYLEAKNNTKSIDDLFYFITKEPEGNITFAKDKDGFTLGQGTAGSTMTFRVEKDKVIRISPAENNFSWSKKELDKTFKDYQKLVEKLVVIGKENMENHKKTEVETAKKETVDPKNLTEEQAITWIKNYLIQNGATEEGLNKDSEFQSSMLDGYLVVTQYLPVPTGAHKKITYQFRVNSNGQLEKRYITSGEDWEVISTEYIYKEDLEGTVATKNDISASMVQDGNDGPGIFYTLIIKNTSDHNIKVSAEEFTLNKNSSLSDVKEDIPARYQKNVVIPAGKEHKFTQLLGPVSGDTAYYFNLDAIYQGEVIFHQTAGMKNDK